MTKAGKGQLCLGVHVGEAKITAALVDHTGAIVARKRRAASRESAAEETLAAVDQALAKGETEPDALRAIGLAAPGVVHPDEGRVPAAPTMDLTGLEVAAAVKERYGVPVALGNDANLSTLGEKWLGAARHAQSVVGIFVGTRIGGGVIADGKLVRGSRGGAGDVGHLVMRPDGPLCACGSRGCLDVFASRAAIERDIREAMAAGRRTILAEKPGQDDRPIKSKTLKRALKAEDPLVTEVVRGASEMLGCACRSVRHLIDPEAIVLGGEVIRACGKFIMPIVREIVAADSLAGARAADVVVPGELGDDAAVLGAVALAQELAGGSPLSDALEKTPEYPKISNASFGEVVVGEKVYTNDIYIRANGRVKKRNKKPVKERYGTSHKIGPEELEKVCKGDPTLLVIGIGHDGMAGLTSEGEEFLRRRGIAARSLTTGEAIEEFNRATGRKAALIHVTC